METMHYSERKRSSKGPVIGFLLFTIIGVTILVLAMQAEEQPNLIGQEESDIQRLVDIEKQDKEEVTSKNANIQYEVKDVKYSDDSNSKIKSEITLPSITVNGTELGEINVKIDKDYTELFEQFKEQLRKAESKYTYIVSYDKYENMVGTQKILSIVITQRMRDDSAKKNSMEKKETYNIDLEKQKVITEAEVVQELLGKDYKTIVRSTVQDYIVNEGMLKESEFTYAFTGLENFYIQDGTYHIIFNEGELVDKKYGVLDIAVQKEEE